jgi:uncharacterized cupin superfamily protein
MPAPHNRGVDVFNLFGDDWERENDRDGFRWRAVAFGKKLGSELLGGTLYELPPGERTWPYHFERANEEWLLCVAGRPTLRTPEGERELAPGDLAAFPRGPAGAHAVVNNGDETARVAILSTKLAVDVIEYPDSGKVGLWDGEYVHLLRTDAKVGYWDGEE